MDITSHQKTEEEFRLDAEDILLLLFEANERLLGKRTFNGVTRLEKLIFLLRKEADFTGVEGLFGFKPHNFGPFSKTVYEAADFLEGCDLVEIRDRVYPSYYENMNEAQLSLEISDEDTDMRNVGDGSAERLFLLTAAGRTVAQKLRDTVGKEWKMDLNNLDQIVLRFGNKPLNQIIRYVYRRYPEMTVKSVIGGQ